MGFVIFSLPCLRTVRSYSNLPVYPCLFRMILPKESENLFLALERTHSFIYKRKIYILYMNIYNVIVPLKFHEKGQLQKSVFRSS